MNKHTPGPWTPYFDETYGVLGPDKGRVAICMNLKGAHGLAGRRGGDEVAANTRLIAAAPDLLESIQELIAAQNAEGRPAGGFSLKPATREHQRRVFLAWQRIHAAIAKATGENK